jgi:hypothetical protein
MYLKHTGSQLNSEKIMTQQTSVPQISTIEDKIGWLYQRLRDLDSAIDRLDSVVSAADSGQIGPKESTDPRTISEHLDLINTELSKEIDRLHALTGNIENALGGSKITY